MAKTGLQNEELLKRIQEKGSTALKGKNPFGVNVFSGSVTDDGVVSGQLTKTKYNPQELVKSVDTNIFELLPPEIPPTPDVVPRPIYNEALQRISELEIDVQNLNIEISDLTSLVSDLRVTTQSLRIDLDAKDLLVASVENQNQQSVQQTQGSILDLQNSIQRATSEAIERTSIEAINESLLVQIDGLNETITGLNAQVRSLNEQLVNTQNELTRRESISEEQQQGAYGGEDITANPQPQTQTNFSPITWRGRPSGGNYDKVNQFINGSTIILFNPNDSSISGTIESTGFRNNAKPYQRRNFTIPPNGRTTVNMAVDLGEVDGKIKEGNSRSYSGEVVVRTSTESFSIPAEIQIQRGNRYTPR